VPCSARGRCSTSFWSWQTLVTLAAALPDGGARCSCAATAIRAACARSAAVDRDLAHARLQWAYRLGVVDRSLRLDLGVARCPSCFLACWRGRCAVVERGSGKRLGERLPNMRALSGDHAASAVASWSFFRPHNHGSNLPAPRSRRPQVESARSLAGHAQRQDGRPRVARRRRLRRPTGRDVLGAVRPGGDFPSSVRDHASRAPAWRERCSRRSPECRMYEREGAAVVRRSSRPYECNAGGACRATSSRRRSGLLFPD